MNLPSMSLLKAIARRMLNRSRPSDYGSRAYGYAGIFASWAEANENIHGYGDPEIAAKVAMSTSKVLAGDAIYERDSVLLDHVEYAFSVIAALLWGAKVSPELRILDFGGGLGTSYQQSHVFLSGIENLSWTIVEQQSFVEHGKVLFDGHAEVAFFTDIDDAILHKKPNIIIASSSLQYVESPFAVIAKFIESRADLIIIDRTIFSTRDEDEITRQYVDPNIFSAVIPAWIFSEKKFVDFFYSQYRLFSRHPATTSTDKTDLDGRLLTELGFLFVRRDSKFDQAIGKKVNITQ